MGYGLWAMGYGLWAMGYGLWAMGYGQDIKLASCLSPIAHRLPQFGMNVSRAPMR